ncbi:MAG: dihydrolipoyllysine-residue acetyltransferase [Gammaproteobacteria bacterium]|nr:dihydrolipoyllysine-residue acetyltransferase [Gammaproteobacteria bacterium]
MRHRHQQTQPNHGLGSSNMANEEKVLVPDIGDFAAVEVIEILVASGDTVSAEDSLVTLESDKATMEIPAPANGVVGKIEVNIGDTLSEGDLVMWLHAADSSAAATEVAPTEAAPAAATAKPTPAPEAPKAAAPAPVPAAPAPVAAAPSGNSAHASPAVRRFARELGADISRIGGSGRKGRILKSDVQGFIKVALSGTGSNASSASVSGSGLAVAAMPNIDYSKFGEVENLPLSKINKITGQVLHRNWVTIPHVTQFDDADITDLEAFRKQLVGEYKDRGIKITLLAFLMKAVVSALKQFPRFNASLDASGENLILKKYYHIGIAVATPDGLVVPVVRDVDQKSLVELAQELTAISIKARDKKLGPKDMQGGCFTISSLGGLGGSAFTPIVNAPEVAILGVSRSAMKPIYQPDGEFAARLMLPLSLSYDHRVIDGADGARFTSYLSRVLADMRRLLL